VQTRGFFWEADLQKKINDLKLIMVDIMIFLWPLMCIYKSIRKERELGRKLILQLVSTWCHLNLRMYNCRFKHSLCCVSQQIQDFLAVPDKTTTLKREHIFIPFS